MSLINAIHVKRLESRTTFVGEGAIFFILVFFHLFSINSLSFTINEEPKSHKKSP